MNRMGPHGQHSLGAQVGHNESGEGPKVAERFCVLFRRDFSFTFGHGYRSYCAGSTYTVKRTSACVLPFCNRARTHQLPTAGNCAPPMNMPLPSDMGCASPEPTGWSLPSRPYSNETLSSMTVRCRASIGMKLNCTVPVGRGGLGSVVSRRVT